MLDFKNWFGESPKDCVVDKSNARRNFIIMPNGHILMSTIKANKSHRELLKTLNYGEKSVNDAIMNFPLGYFENGRIVFFQGDLLKPETVTGLGTNNIALAKSKLPDLREMLECADNTPVYFNVPCNKFYKVIEKLKFNSSSLIARYKKMLHR
jgi:hypothetical protein